MNKVTRACLLVVALLALAGLAAAQSHPRQHFNLDDVDGRYVSAENAFDVSSVHAFAAPDASLVGGPVFFATSEVMVADGKGNVCGESDGFYGGFPPPGVNLGPSLYHGTYTVGATDGRIVITTCSDGAPSPTNTFCGTSTACDVTGASAYKTQAGYISDRSGTQIVTVEQINNSDSSLGGCCATTGFLVHKRAWSKAAESESERERGRGRGHERD